MSPVFGKRAAEGAAAWFLCLVVSVGQAAPCPSEARAKADALLKQAVTLKGERLDEPTVKKCITLLEEATRICPGHEGAWIELSACYWQIGDWLPATTDADKQKRMEWFAKGEAAADKALAINPKSIGGLYWKTVNMASIADMKGWASSLWLFPTLLKNMDAVDAMDPHWEYGATKRFWCEVLSRVPLFLANRFGYKPEDVAADLDQEIKREPRYFQNYIYAARLSWKMGQKDKALGYLDYVLKHDPAELPGRKAENQAAQRDARRLWKEWTGKEWPAR